MCKVQIKKINISLKICLFLFILHVLEKCASFSCWCNIVDDWDNVYNCISFLMICLAIRSTPDHLAGPPAHTWLHVPRSEIWFFCWTGVLGPSATKVVLYPVWQMAQSLKMRKSGSPLRCSAESKSVPQCSIMMLQIR